MDTINSAERVNRFSGYSESDINNNLHSYRHGQQRMHSIDTSDSECESASGDCSNTSSCNLRWTADGNAHRFRCINVLMDTINSAERVNGFTYHSESDINDNLHCYRHGQ